MYRYGTIFLANRFFACFTKDFTFFHGKLSAFLRKAQGCKLSYDMN